MRNRVLRAILLLLPVAALFSPAAQAQTVRFETNLGDIDVILMPESAPATVENFLRYLNRGSFTNTFFHRSAFGPGLHVIQGGGYQWNNGPQEIPADPAVRNEYRISNTRGTIAMAKLGNNPNSATTQWFFNVADNSSNLNNQNGGFTVFGRVADSASLTIMDRIASVPVYNAGQPFDQLPLQNYRGGVITASNLALVRSITVIAAAPPAIAADGVISASAFGGFASAAAGSYIEIYGANLAGAAREWSGSDFVEGRAPTTLAGVSVTVDGKPAFVSYVSPTQVNVQVPAGVPLTGSVPVVVTHEGKSSAAATLTVKETAGGLLAPRSFNVNGKQYAAALHHDSNKFVSNGSIPDVPAAPAVPGKVLVFYGVGFGPVSPGVVEGQIAKGTTATTRPVQFQFGDTPAQVLYSGLVPELVGLYQFNVVVPEGLPNGDAQLKVLVGGEAISQTLYVPVQAAN